MTNTFSKNDNTFMSLAIQEAKKSAKKGNYPCGAVLVVDDQVIGKAQNLKENRRDRVSHAETLLYIKYSSALRLRKSEGAIITMYTTLEPCIMCFGAAIMHRVDRIVAASPDPYGNMSKLDGSVLGEFYKDSLPKLEYGLLFDQSFGLIRKFLDGKGGEESERLIRLFSGIKTSLAS